MVVSKYRILKGGVLISPSPLVKLGRSSLGFRTCPEEGRAAVGGRVVAGAEVWVTEEGWRRAVEAVCCGGGAEGLDLRRESMPTRKVDVSERAWRGAELLDCNAFTTSM